MINVYKHVNGEYIAVSDIIKTNYGKTSYYKPTLKEAILKMRLISDLDYSVVRCQMIKDKVTFVLSTKSVEAFINDYPELFL